MVFGSRWWRCGAHDRLSCSVPFRYPSRCMMPLSVHSLLMSWHSSAAVLLCLLEYKHRITALNSRYIQTPYERESSMHSLLHRSQNKLFLLRQVQKVSLPDAVGQAEVTSLCYSTGRILYTGTNSGHVCVWDCNTQRCFVTWEADGGEIGVFGFLLFWSHLWFWSQGNRITSCFFFFIV